MKKLILFTLAALFLVSCYTPRVNQMELYGTVEEVLFYNGRNHVKTWCKEKGKYYEIITDKTYCYGDTIRIR